MTILLIAIWILGVFAPSNIVAWWVLTGVVLILGCLMSNAANKNDGKIEKTSLKNVKELLEDRELVEFIEENLWVINAMWFPTFLFVFTAIYLYLMSLTIPAVMMLITSYFMFKMNKRLVMLVKEKLK